MCSMTVEKKRLENKSTEPPGNRSKFNETEPLIMYKINLAIERHNEKS